tara:strand:- start:56 stop:343 length:288 start_codon:yes stop_codon:yes gene_type:complete
MGATIFLIIIAFGLFFGETILIVFLAYLLSKAGLREHKENQILEEKRFNQIQKLLADARTSGEPANINILKPLVEALAKQIEKNPIEQSAENTRD